MFQIASKNTIGTVLHSLSFSLELNSLNLAQLSSLQGPSCFTLKYYWLSAAPESLY